MTSVTTEIERSHLLQKNNRFKEQDNIWPSKNDFLIVISSVWGMTDEIYSGTSCKDMSRSLQVLQARNDKVRITIIDRRTPKRCTVAILDTSAGPNLDRKFCISWLDQVKKVLSYFFNSVATTLHRVTGFLRLHLTIGSSTVVVGLLVHDNLAVEVLLGTALVSTYVETISPKGRRIKMTQGGMTGILESALGSDRAKTATMTQEQLVDKV